jgi:GNAT superfamily N-acetyltransferase
MVSEILGIREKIESSGIGLKDALAVIGMTLEDQQTKRLPQQHYAIFEGLNGLIDRTAHGTKIERFLPDGKGRNYHTFEIHAQGGDVLGYLNMIYLRKPIPCHYLVYVEVVSPFRGRGLGNKILRAFKEFVEQKGTVGLLDNIIPQEDVTYGIYTKLGWRGVEELIGNGMFNKSGNYMVFVPTSIKIADLRGKLTQLLFNLLKKRPVIDMHDNEAMVKRTIQEFRSVYEALERLFEKELSSGTYTPIMRFMFTKFVTKLLGFRRRITELLGYTGGESLEQITISERIKDLPIQPYSLWGSDKTTVGKLVEEGFTADLPEGLNNEPTLFIESLPLYRRPYLSSWIIGKGESKSHDLKISDLLELGFDPTRLRHFCHGAKSYIFERLAPHFLSSIERKRTYFPEIAEKARGMRFNNATIRTNPPLAIIQDRGNVYVLRSQVDGIHSEEALDQLRASASLKAMNHAVGIERAVVKTVNEIKDWLRSGGVSALDEEIEELTFFVPWELEKNTPQVLVDITGISFNSVWIA